MFIIAFYFLSFSLNSNSYSLDIFLVFYSLFLVYLFIFLSYNIIFHFFHKFTKFLVHLFLCTCLCWGNGTFLVSEFLRQGSFSYPQVIAWLCVPVFCFFLNQVFFFFPPAYVNWGDFSAVNLHWILVSYSAFWYGSFPCCFPISFCCS